MKIKEYLNEELDEPVEYKKINSNRYAFTVDGKIVYDVIFEQPFNGEGLSRLSKATNSQLTNKNTINFSFSAHLSKTEERDDLTGTGHVKKVFSTIINIFKEWLKTNKPKYILLIGDQEHYKFYSMLVGRIGNYTSEYVKKTATFFIDNHIILLERKGMNENFEEYTKPIINKSNTAYPIFSFPLKPGELKELSEANNGPTKNIFRIIADKDRQKIYIFPSKLLHAEVDKALKINKYKFNYNNPKMIYNIVLYKNNEFILSTAFKDGKSGWEFLFKYLKVNGESSVNENFEQYVKLFNGNDRTYTATPIFSFPLKNDELKELLKFGKEHGEYRIIADSNNKKVYIFTGEMFHKMADEKLNINKYDEPISKSGIYYGIVHYLGSSKFVSHLLKSLVKKDNKWEFALNCLEGKS